MTFRDEVNENTRTVMVETLIRTVFAKSHRKVGDIVEDLLDSDEIDDDWMKDTLFEMEISEFVRAGMRIMGLDGKDEVVLPDLEEDADEEDQLDAEDNHVSREEEDGSDVDNWPESQDEVDEDGLIVEEDEEGTSFSLPEEKEEEEEAKPKKRKKKKKKDKKPKKKAKPGDSARKPPKKKKKKKAPDSVPARAPKEDEDPDWTDYKKLVVKTMRKLEARNEEDAVNNAAILNEMHGEDNWDKDESSALRQALTEHHKDDKVGKTGKARGTRYYLN